MAGVNVEGGGGRRRSTNSEVNMIPFIDLLMVTIAFLLITAVWTNRSRIQADAQVPSQSGCSGDCTAPEEKKLFVHVGERSFELVWRQAKTVVSQTSIPKSPLLVGEGGASTLRYPDLADAIQREWSRHGQHVDPGDRKVDQAVVQTDDRAPFGEIVAVLDAIHSTRRDMKDAAGARVSVPAFNLVFASR